jgi:hypothetical protein
LLILTFLLVLIAGDFFLFGHILHFFCYLLNFDNNYVYCKYIGKVLRLGKKFKIKSCVSKVFYQIISCASVSLVKYENFMNIAFFFHFY